MEKSKTEEDLDTTLKMINVALEQTQEVSGILDSQARFMQKLEQIRKDRQEVIDTIKKLDKDIKQWPLAVFFTVFGSVVVFISYKAYRKCDSKSFKNPKHKKLEKVLLQVEMALGGVVTICGLAGLWLCFSMARNKRFLEQAIAPK